MVWPFLEVTKSLFTEHITNTVVVSKPPQKPTCFNPHLTMAFPAAAFQCECQLAFGILDAKLKHLAWKWFVVIVETDAGSLRCVTSENGGSSIIPGSYYHTGLSSWLRSWVSPLYFATYAADHKVRSRFHDPLAFEVFDLTHRMFSPRYEVNR